jgi:hypothetical protein
MSKNILLAALVVASVTTTITTQAGEVGFGVSLVNWKKTVNGGQPVPVYYAPAQLPVYQPAQAATAAPAAPAPQAAPVAQAPTMVAVPAGNGTYTLVPVVPAQPVVPQTYLIPANQVPIAKEEKSWSIGPRVSFFANK